MKTVRLQDRQALISEIERLYPSEFTADKVGSVVDELNFKGIEEFVRGSSIHQAGIAARDWNSTRGIDVDPKYYASAMHALLLHDVTKTIASFAQTSNWRKLGRAQFNDFMERSSKEKLKEFAVEYTSGGYTIVERWINVHQAHNVLRMNWVLVFLHPEAVEYLRRRCEYRHPNMPETMRPMLHDIVEILHNKHGCRVFEAV